jgi:hypothetical protein
MKSRIFGAVVAAILVSGVVFATGNSFNVPPGYKASDTTMMQNFGSNTEFDCTSGSIVDTVIPAMPGYVFAPITARFFLTVTAGALSTSPTIKSGNNATNDNLIASATLSLTSAYSAGAPAMAGSPTVLATGTKFVDLATPILFKITTGATGTGGFVCKGKFFVQGFLVKL